MRDRPLSVHYGIDGLFTFAAISIVSNNNNLFAQRLGAGDFHLSMIMFLPQIIMVILLIPAGLFTDSLKNRRRMIAISLFVGGVFYALAGASAFVPVGTVYIFLGMIALAVVSNGMYNLSWLSFFPEVVPEEEGENRNTVLTFRARMTMLVQLLFPLAIGGVLTSVVSHEGSIRAHQLFYLAAAILFFMNAFHFRKIKPTMPAAPKRVTFTELKTAAKRLSKNKNFVLFTAAILFFHMTWHVDWTLYFIGQRNYLLMNPFLLSLGPFTATVAQLLTLKLWSKNNIRQGVEKPLAYGMFGLALCPVAMIAGVSISGSLGIGVFLTIHFIGHLAFANLSLNMFQCLFKVADEGNRSFSISVYTLLITLSNGVMPVAGVALYRALGGDRQGLVWAFMIVFFLRIAAGIIWLLRVKYASKMAEVS